MAKKKAKKAVVKRVESVEESSKKSVIENENRQLFWFFVVVGVVFATVFVSYFFVESLKGFEYGGANWTVEDYGQFDVYHARFASLYRKNMMYNLYLRNDPRKNNVPVEGEFKSFKRGGYISLSQEFESCRGEVSRVMVDLGAFLKSGLGMDAIAVATSDAEFSLRSETPYVNCSNTLDRSVFMIDVGENGVVQDDVNRFCYTITVEDCNDITSVEKFMTEILVAHMGG
ncbi:MAG: hypothetical protein KJ592_01220 [Nanoarchaeota archaeon]|nr:hypothetical protein [Nanoarchaeota archaeon]